MILFLKIPYIYYIKDDKDKKVKIELSKNEPPFYADFYFFPNNMHIFDNPLMTRPYNSTGPTFQIGSLNVKNINPYDYLNSDTIKIHSNILEKWKKQESVAISKNNFDNLYGQDIGKASNMV